MSCSYSSFVLENSPEKNGQKCNMRNKNPQSCETRLVLTFDHADEEIGFIPDPGHAMCRLSNHDWLGEDM